MNITIKIGSNVLSGTGGLLNTERMKSLVAQIADLHRKGNRIILVSSGAVAAGRGMVKGYENLDSVSQRQLLSAVGQVKLIDIYKELFDEHGITIGQILATKQDFGSREHYLNMQNCINALWANNIVPVVNENDAVSVTALMFTDNDELSGLMASMTDCQKLFILSNIDGIFNGDPKDPESKVITEIEAGVSVAQYVQTQKSSFGRGGMITKCRTAQKTAMAGIDVYIANGTTENVISRLASEDPSFIRTHFAAGQKSPAIRKWLAYSDGFAKAKVVVNKGAAEALCNHNKAASLLLPGVVRFEGDFKKGDLLTIVAEDDTVLGTGKSDYDKERALKTIEAIALVGGGTRIKPLIHYDYMQID